MEIFGVPVSEDTVKNTAVSGAAAFALWQFALRFLPWKSWLLSLAAKFLPGFVPKPKPQVQASVGGIKPTDDAVVNEALYTLRTRLKGDSQGQALLDALDSYWWKRGCSPKPVEPAT